MLSAAAAEADPVCTRTVPRSAPSLASIGRRTFSSSGDPGSDPACVSSSARGSGGRELCVTGGAGRIASVFQRACPEDGGFSLSCALLSSVLWTGAFAWSFLRDLNIQALSFPTLRGRFQKPLTPRVEGQFRWHRLRPR